MSQRLMSLGDNRALNRYFTALGTLSEVDKVRAQHAFDEALDEGGTIQDAVQGGLRAVGVRWEVSHG